MPPDASLASGAAPATVDAAIRRAESIIAAGSDGYRSESPRLDAELLLAALRRCDRARLLADLREPLAADDWAGLDRLARRRAAGEPLAYLVGRRGFHGIELRVNPSVLIPRPETELLVDWALAWLSGSSERSPEAVSGGSGGVGPKGQPRIAAARRVIDVGTGSGAIVLALAAALRARGASMRQSELQLLASDVSTAALATSQDNARRLGLDAWVQFRQADLLPEGEPPYDLVLANLPYIGLDERAGLSRDVSEFEPAEALFAGRDGLALIARLLGNLPGRLASGGAAALEIGYAQGPAVRALASAGFPEARIRVHPDLAGHDRLLTIETGP